ncbi:MAG TPA: ABC transporter ATP-binding protein [Thermomicrobiaceae bacterium]|nr:ABC transporter ATP-binding protein [Thermomicrobiaceae bacterium]
MSETLVLPAATAAAETTTAAVETFGLRKVYGERAVVQDLTLRVGDGEVFGFLGPNGAGKTTSVKMLMGLVRPTAGTARLLGRPLGDRQAREQIGFLPEMFRFHDWLTGEQLLDFHGRLYGMSRGERRRRIPEVLETVGLAHSGGQRVRTYSKGMQQRIGIAQALINNPRLVFLDEPTSALDPLGRRDVRAIITRLRDQGVTVFLNSHLLSEVESVSDRVAIITHGRVAAIGPMAELLRRELTVELRLGSAGPEVLAELGKVVTVEHVDGAARPVVIARVPDDETIARAVDLLVRRGVPVYGVMPEHRTLEEVFVDVVGSDGEESR